MKSAYELAMERLGKTTKELPQEVKEKLAAIDDVYKAKIAEAELDLKSRMLKANGNPEALEQIRQDYTVELASINSKCEKEKEKIRNSY